MSSGNRSVLVVLDSAQTANRRSADLTVFAALDHFGVAWNVLDAGDYWSVTDPYLRERAAFIIAHDGAGSALDPTFARTIAEAVQDGAGLLSFDRDPRHWPQPLRDCVPKPAATTTLEALAIGPAPCFITRNHAPGSIIGLLGGTPSLTFVSSADMVDIARCPDGPAVIVAGSTGQGRYALFGMGHSLYDETVLGHTRGLDGLFWRSLVWVAAKPFPMRCIPPFVTSRMDDCNGTYSAFGYVDVLNRHGISPNLGLFVDELGPTDWQAVTRLYQEGGADFSLHAMRDDLHQRGTGWCPYAVLEDKPDLSRGGVDTRFVGVSLDHHTGRDLDPETVAANFARVDALFGQAGIRHSRVLNAHFGEIGRTGLAHFLQRGVDLPCNNSVIGQLYGNQPVWRPRPYCLRAANGRHGLTIDRLPSHPEMVAVGFSAAHLGYTHMTTDILHGHTPFGNEADRVCVEKAIERGIGVARTGLDALAYGILFTHEQRIHCIALDDWNRIVDGIVAGLGDLETIPASREHVSIVCKRLFTTKLGVAEWDGERLRCTLSGVADGPSPLTVWTNRAEACVPSRHDVPGFTFMTQVSV